MKPKRIFKTSIEESPIIMNPNLKNKMLEELANMDSLSKMYIETFLRNLNKSSNFDLTQFYNNFSRDLFFTNHSYKNEGGYFPDSKEIILPEAFKNFYIFHELLHMMSTIFLEKEQKLFAGFSQVDASLPCDKVMEIGRGLTEGYTELLNRRYFSHLFKNSSPIYEPFINISLLLEALIGKDTMEHLYSKADLYNFFIELEKYGTIDEIYSLMRSIDKFYNMMFKSKLILSKNTIYKTYLEILKKITHLYTKAMTIDSYTVIRTYPMLMQILNYKYTIPNLDKIISLKPRDKDDIHDEISETYLKLQNVKPYSMHKTLDK